LTTNSKITHINIMYNQSNIHPNAKIGKNVTIGPYTTINEHVVIGDDCIIGSHVLIDGYTTIGKANHFHPGSTIGCQENIHSENIARLVIGDNNCFRENITIHGSIDPDNTKTIIGDHNLIMSNTHIESGCQISNYIVITNSAFLSPNVIVEDRAKIGGLTYVRSKARIGKLAMIGIRSRILKDVPPYMLADGDPARMRGLNTVGLQRNSTAPEIIAVFKKVYRILYNSNQEIDVSIQKIEQEFQRYPEIDYLINFIKNSQQGITHANKSVVNRIMETKLQSHTQINL
jgi:UDP-N-acetylglucosamine acyltransferase